MATPVQFSYPFVGFETLWDAKEPGPSRRKERRGRRKKRDTQYVCGRGQFPLIYTFPCSERRYLLTQSSLKGSESYIWRGNIVLPFCQILFTKYKKEGQCSMLNRNGEVIQKYKLYWRSLCYCWETRWNSSHKLVSHFLNCLLNKSIWKHWKLHKTVISHFHGGLSQS